MLKDLAPEAHSPGGRRRRAEAETRFRATAVAVTVAVTVCVIAGLLSVRLAAGGKLTNELASWIALAAADACAVAVGDRLERRATESDTAQIEELGDLITIRH